MPAQAHTSGSSSQQCKVVAAIGVLYAGLQGQLPFDCKVQFGLAQGCAPPQHSHFHEAQRALLAAAGAFVHLLPPVRQLGTGGAGRRCLARGRGRKGLRRAFPCQAFRQYALVECSAVLVEYSPYVGRVSITELWQVRHSGYGQIRLAAGSWAVKAATESRSLKLEGCTRTAVCKAGCRHPCPRPSHSPSSVGPCQIIACAPHHTVL